MWRLFLFARRPVVFGAIVTFVLVSSSSAFASDEAHGVPGLGMMLLWVAAILFIAKSASLVERIGQPAVLGELLAGIALGNAALVGITFFEPLKTDALMRFFAELGAVILLFQAGLESNLAKIATVGGRAFIVAVLGVVGPELFSALVLVIVLTTLVT
ncbi:MAG: cation:proton antiporter, partial [Patescibacteria group bacterium]|nr:cation:proton antiporter [Patescibacteria group bacterium]